MGQAIPRQHPAVVLRSHFNQLRALLAVAMVAIVGLTVAVVILANDDEVSTSSSTTSVAAPVGTTRADGGPEEGTRGIVRQPTADASLGARMDHGPEEGTADVTAAQPRVTQQQAFPGLAGQANSAQSPSSPSQSATKDYSLNGATGDYSAPPAAPSTRSDGGPEEGSALR
jgi:cell division protein FtsN